MSGLTLIHRCVQANKAIVLLLVVYLSWRQSPQMADAYWMPSFLGLWADEFVRARTAVPFVFLGFLNGITQCLRNESIVAFGKSVLAYTAFAVLVELGQLLLPTRHCDPLDMVWALVGVMVGQVPWLSYQRHRNIA